MTSKIQTEREAARVILEQFRGVGLVFTLQMVSDLEYIVAKFAEGEKYTDAHFARKILNVMETICWYKDLSDKKITKEELLKRIDQREQKIIEQKMVAFEKKLDKAMKPKKKR